MFAQSWQCSAKTGTPFLYVHRLHKTDEFSSVFAFRRVLRGRIFHVHYQPQPLTSARLGVVVAKKLAKRAVTRNLIKRLVREDFRRLRSVLPPFDLIVRLAANPSGLTRRELHEDLAVLLDKVRQLNCSERSQAVKPTTAFAPSATFSSS